MQAAKHPLSFLVSCKYAPTFMVTTYRMKLKPKECGKIYQKSNASCIRANSKKEM
jgi:hypothetical protein